MYLFIYLVCLLCAGLTRERMRLYRLWSYQFVTRPKCPSHASLYTTRECRAGSSWALPCILLLLLLLKFYCGLVYRSQRESVCYMTSKLYCILCTSYSCYHACVCRRFALTIVTYISHLYITTGWRKSRSLWARRYQTDVSQGMWRREQDVVES